MQTVPGTTPAVATEGARPRPQGSPLRLGILLFILAICIGALAYDNLLAKPSAEAAHAKIGALNEKQNALRATKSERMTSEFIQKELGRRPTWIDKQPLYTVEYYCAWGHVPVLNMRRHYNALVFVGDEPRRLSSHYFNERPPEEALPVVNERGPEPSGELAPAVGGAPAAEVGAGVEAASASATVGDSAQSADPPKGKRRGKRGASEKASTEPDRENRDTDTE